MGGYVVAYPLCSFGAGVAYSNVSTSYFTIGCRQLLLVLV